MGIQEYLCDLLNNQLRDIKYRYREQIVNDIRNRMCALLAGYFAKWKDFCDLQLLYQRWTHREAKKNFKSMPLSKEMFDNVRNLNGLPAFLKMC